ncbi:perlucin-like protein [Mytilus californianus]|uniref:perlucin-like protein n=1 Tax=Mytilus californianus TaxID=6549 RepID=UPI0022482033|nr:perlucin-like protein [Mytilus californianus]XP_052073523.1 perlucin-like protein [Mytilus californianus]
MRLLLLTALVLSIVALTIPGRDAAQPLCQIGWKKHGNNCYYFSISRTSWGDAKRKCKLLKGQLAEATTRNVITFLKTNAKRNKQTFWLGGTDLVQEGEWIWITSGERFAETDWHTRTIREPNNQDEIEHCLTISDGLNYEWNDDNCYDSYSYICEKSLRTVM